MYRFFAIALWVFLAMRLHAHVYTPMAVEGMHWVCTTQSNYHRIEYKIEGDTAINNTAYKRVYKMYRDEYGDEQFHYFGAVRDQERRTYILYAEESEHAKQLQSRCDPQTGELLLYDFSLGGIIKKGVEGGIEVGGLGGWNGLVNGVERRFIFFHSIDIPDVIDGFLIVEGFGLRHWEPFLPHNYLKNKNLSTTECYKGSELLCDIPSLSGVPDELPSGDANGDGVTDVDDLNLIINVMLTKQIPETGWDDVSASIYRFPDIEHVNLVINKMLGRDVDVIY